MSSEIKNCPFCDEREVYWDEVIIDGEQIHFLTCPNCEAQGPTGADHAEVIEKWNRRAA
jgi:Lar family restriction alleviation protein